MYKNLRANVSKSKGKCTKNLRVNVKESKGKSKGKCTRI